MNNLAPFSTTEQESATSPMENEFDLRAILALLRRHLRLIFTTILVVVAIAGAAVFTLRPVYTASTLILVDPSRKNLLNPEDAVTNSSSDSARVESEVELVRSETTLLRAIKDLDLINDPEFGVRIGLKDQLLALLRIAQPATPSGDQLLQSIIISLRNSITVQRRGLTYLISIEARSNQPAIASRNANAIAKAYIQEQLEAKIGATLASRDIIQSRIADASATVSNSEQAFDEFIAKNLDRISSETGRTDLLGLRQQLEQLNAKRSELAAVAQLAQSGLARQDWEAVASSLKSEAVSKLDADRKRLEESLAGAADGTQRSIDLRAELGRLNEELTQTANSELTSLRQQVTTAQAQATDLRVQLRSSVLSTNLPAEVLTSIYELQQNAELARTQYQTLLARMRDLDAQAYLQVADSRVVSEALPPGRPSFPNPTLIIGFATVLAIGLSIGLAFLVENYVGGFTSEGQLKSVLKTRAVASVPRVRPRTAPRGSNEALTVAENVTRSPLSLFAEAVRRIRIALDQSVRRGSRSLGTTGQVVMVTSASPNEGKTTISLSLARAYALSGRSTLLIDCDLRKPSLHKQLGMEAGRGLLEYLVEDKAAEPSNPVGVQMLLTLDTESGAQVILGSRRSDIPTDQLIGGPKFLQLIETAKRHFDVVVLDTPPVGPVVDGLYLAPLADAILFVIRWTSTSQRDARAAVSALSEAKRDQTEIVAVLNQQVSGRRGYSYRYAGYYTET